MDRIRIVGGNKLNGIIPISGAKNAALPLMIAALLTDETLILDNVPRLADVAQLQRILGNHGVDIMAAGKRPGDGTYQGQTLHISSTNIVDTTAPYELVSKMRASFWVIAPLLARMKEAKVSLPGGCAIGTRPVDLLIMALDKLGAQIRIDGGYVIAIKSVGANGQLDAMYFNPAALPFAQARALRQGDMLRAHFELQAGGYAGSTYDLTYDAASDQLKGSFYQAVARQRFEVHFVRRRA